MIEMRSRARSCGLLLLLLALQIATFINLVNGGDKCDDLEDLKYELFATKTTYEDARQFLRKADDDDLPSSFDDDKLEKEHNELRKDGCTPMVFYFIGRHSARFPDGEDIDNYNKDLAELVGKMGSATPKCQRRRGDFFRWRSKMRAKQDNLITDLGGREERDIARRFKRLYPEFFNVSKADIQIGVTDKIRTAQTGAEFLREVEGLNLAGCDERSTPTNDVEKQEYNLEKVLEAVCYKHLIDMYERPFLEFHKQCEKIGGGEEKPKDARIERVKNPQLKQRIADRVARRLGLDNAASTPPPVTPDVLESIYNMCRFENALTNDSIWCDLFDKRDIEALEYIEDVNSYIKSAYGPKANVRQSCPLVGDLVKAMREGQQLTRDQRRRAYFYFSHADPIKKLLATFNMFRDDDSFSERRISDFERELKVPKKRSWRTSVITPFSANLAFVLYRCEPKSGSRREPKFKILATVTEQPVKLGGCKDTDCNLQHFFDTYASMQNCDLNQVCRRQ